MKDTTQTLLDNIHEILLKEKEQKSQDPKEFNPYSIVRVETDEVRLHTRFLGELLNPLGSHHQGGLFLKLFLEKIGLPGILEANSTKVHMEHYIGNISENFGGQIDLLLTDDLQNSLLIENKIFAPDQPNQMLRYHEYLKNRHQTRGKGTLVYLNLFGSPPHNSSTQHLEKDADYFVISYRNQILDWLKSCLVSCSNKPVLFHAIEQYKYIIENITHSNQNSVMTNDIIYSLTNSIENYRSAELIHQNFEASKLILLKRFGTALRESLLEKTDLPIYLDEHFGSQYHGLEILFDKNQDLNDFQNRCGHIRFSFLSNARDCYIEIHPGIKNGQNLNKNPTNIQTYKLKLNEPFQSMNAKIISVENAWQGEWVAKYSYLDNSFEKMITFNLAFSEEVANHLMLIVNAVVK